MPLTSLPSVPTRRGIQAETIAFHGKAGGGHEPPGALAAANVATCRRWVLELRNNLATLAERCGGLEVEHEGVLNCQSQCMSRFQRLGCDHSDLMERARCLAAQAEAEALAEHRYAEEQRLKQELRMQQEETLLGRAQEDASAASGTRHVSRERPPEQSGDATQCQQGAPTIRCHDVQGSRTVPMIPQLPRTGNSRPMSRNSPRACKVPSPMADRAAGSGIAAPSAACVEQPPRTTLGSSQSLPSLSPANLGALPNLAAPTPTAEEPACQAISDVWARYHPSRGGSSSLWWNGAHGASPSLGGLAGPGGAWEGSTPPASTKIAASPSGPSTMPMLPKVPGLCSSASMGALAPSSGGFAPHAEVPWRLAALPPSTLPPVPPLPSAMPSWPNPPQQLTFPVL